MKFYAFVDNLPALPSLVVIEGTERSLADRAIVAIEHSLDPATRELNAERFSGPQLESMEAVEAACATLPFLGGQRVIVVRDAQAMRVAARRALWEVAQRVPTGNTLVIEDLQSPQKKTKPETFGQLAGTAALRVDVTASRDVRMRFIREALTEFGATAEPDALAALAAAQTDLASIRTDLSKLALSGRITLEAVLRESATAADVKAYRVAGALVSGRAAEALSLAYEWFAAEGERAGFPLFAAIAAEYRLVWECARPGGEVPARLRWRERELRSIAARLGPRGARQAFERALRLCEASVTERTADSRAAIAGLAALAKGEHG